MSKFKFEIMENWLIRVIIKLGGVKWEIQIENTSWSIWLKLNIGEYFE